MAVYIAYANDVGYYIMDDEGYMVSAKWFREYETAEEYCWRNGYEIMDMEYTN